MQIPSMPLSIVVLAPFTSDATAWKQGPVDIDAYTFDDVMAGLKPAFSVPVPHEVCPAGFVDISLTSMKDFHPDGLAKSNTFLNHLLAARQYIEDAKRRGMSVQDMVSGLSRWPDLPAFAVPDTASPSQDTTSSALDNILNMVSIPQHPASPAGKAAPLTLQIDSIIQQSLYHIFMNEDFRRCEAVWRGLQFLVKQIPAERSVRIRIVPVTPDTLEETLEELLEILISDAASLIVTDLGFDISARSLMQMEKLASFSETLLVPGLAWITPGFLHIDSWDELKRLPHLPNYLDEMTFAKWGRLRGLDSARWLSLCCNRFLTRYPYGSDNPSRVSGFEEEAALWISPVWAAASLMVKSQARYGWPTRFNAFREIYLEDLPLVTGENGKQLSTEGFFSDERADQLLRCGIMPLMGLHNRDTACMPRETTAGGISLSHQMFVSLISRLILWCRDHLGGGLTPRELEDTLKRVFSLFWQQSSNEEPEDLNISAVATDREDRILVSLSVRPPLRTLSSQDRVNMEFYW